MSSYKSFALAQRVSIGFRPFRRASPWFIDEMARISNAEAHLYLTIDDAFSMIDDSPGSSFCGAAHQSHRL